MEKARYILFSFPEYYPSGGMGDAEFSFDTKREAEKKIDELEYSLPTCGVQLFDTETFKITDGFNFEDVWNEMVRGE